MTASSSSGAAPLPLEIRSLGVMGFLIQRGNQAVMTAPMFTRASLVAVTAGSITADGPAISAGLAGLPMENVRAILSGHAHYDHFLDVPYTLLAAPNATVFTNQTGRHLLAALAPQRPASCTNPRRGPMVDPTRLRAVDDPAASVVDYRMCPQARPSGAPLEGTWQPIAGTRIRVLALCGTHPDQFLFFHLGGGAVEQDQCDLPTAANDWREGTTVMYLVDFLGDDGSPEFRVYYQDAPTNAPVGHVPPEVLAEKAVDVALLCVGTYDKVEDHPGQLVTALMPRFGISGHWEDFFQDANQPERPYPLLDLNTYMSRAETALSGAPDVPLLVDGATHAGRHVLAQRGMTVVVPPQP